MTKGQGKRSNNVFLCNCTPPKLLDIATSDFAAKEVTRCRG